MYGISNSEYLFRNPVQAALQSNKLDGVGPVDYRPSTDKLNHFVKKKNKKNVTRDMWHMTRHTWQRQ